MFVAEVVMSHVERQPVPQTWSGGGKAAVAMTDVSAWNRTSGRRQTATSDDHYLICYSRQRGGQVP